MRDVEVPTFKGISGGGGITVAGVDTWDIRVSDGEEG